MDRPMNIKIKRISQKSNINNPSASNSSPLTLTPQRHSKLTWFIIWCRYSHLHRDLCALHLCCGRSQQVDEASPEVPHLHHLRSYGETVTDTWSSFQVFITQVVCLTADLDLRTTWVHFKPGGRAAETTFLSAVHWSNSTFHPLLTIAAGKETYVFIPGERYRPVLIHSSSPANVCTHFK